MSGSINLVTLLGNVGKDPEVRRTQDGKPIVTLSVATSETWRDKASGEKRERTEWSRVVIFNEGLAGVAEKYVHKGSKILVQGSLQTRKWTDQAGVERYSTEVVLQGFNSQLVLLDGKKDEAGDTRPANDYPAATGRSQRSLAEDMNDEIPF